MYIFLKIKLQLLAILLIGQIAVLGDEKSLMKEDAQEISQQYKTITVLWPKDQSKYTHMTSELLKDISIKSDFPPEVVISIVQNILEKKNAPLSLQQDLLNLQMDAIHQLANYMNASEVSKHQKIQMLQIICNYYTFIQKNVNLNYSEKPVSMNVPLPDKIVGTAGMNPNNIDDPELKKQYLEAIEENKENSLNNTMQYLFQRAKLQLNIIVGNYVEMLSINYPSEKNNIDDIVKKSGFSN